MRIPWLKTNRPKTQLGVFIGKDRVDICGLSSDHTDITILDSAPVAAGRPLVETLSELISRHNLQSSDCYFVLSNQLYHLLQIDKPKVPDNEIANALPFIAKEFISEPVSNVTLDYFRVPNQPKINLVYCAKSLVENIISACQQAKVNLCSIGIEELSTANFFRTENSTQMLISQQSHEEIILTIIYNNELYFSRRLRGYARLRDLQVDQLDSTLIDSFSLEIQRSADFVVSQLKIPEVSNINITIPSAIPAQLIARLQDNFTIKVSPLNHELINENIDVAFLPAIGGVLEGTL